MYRAELLDGKLTETQINDLMAAQAADISRMMKNDEYAKGLNSTIIDKADKDTGIPDNRIPIPYAKKILNTIYGYMFGKPIRYISKNETTQGKIIEFNRYSKNNKKNSIVGRFLLLQGLAVKLFYVDTDGKVSYSVPDPKTVIPVFDYSVDENLVALIRYYTKKQSDNSNVVKVEIYYKDSIDYYDKGGSYTLAETKPHGFGIVPASVYLSTDEKGIFESVLPIIDGIDTIISTDMNEIQRFEVAYLIMKGQIITGEDVDEATKKGVFQLDRESSLEYLTKVINGDFNNSVLDFLVDQVHKQTGVVDFSSKDFAALSGIALQYKLLDLETVASMYESTFRNAEDVSLDLVFAINNRITESFDNDIEIYMDRNLPNDIASKVAVAAQLQQIGVSMKTVLENLPNVESAEDELEQIKKEKEENMAQFMGNQNIEEPQRKNQFGGELEVDVE